MARILVVEDEAVIAQVIRRLLEPHGHDVVIADDGSRGFAAAQRQAIDLIILDLMMPVMDGFSALEALRGNERTASIPVMVLSARSDDETQRRCREFGAETFLQKPFESEGLLQAVENLVASPTAYRRREWPTQGSVPADWGSRPSADVGTRRLVDAARDENRRR